MKKLLFLFALLTLSVTLTSHVPCNDTYIESVDAYPNNAYAYCKMIPGANWYDFRFKPVADNNWIQAKVYKCKACDQAYLYPLMSGVQYEVQAKTSCSGWSASKTFTTP